MFCCFFFFFSSPGYQGLPILPALPCPLGHVGLSPPLESCLGTWLAPGSQGVLLNTEAKTIWSAECLLLGIQSLLTNLQIPALTPTCVQTLELFHLGWNPNCATNGATWERFCNFFICKMGIKIVPVFQGFCKHKWKKLFHSISKAFFFTGQRRNSFSCQPGWSGSPWKPSKPCSGIPMKGWRGPQPPPFHYTFFLQSCPFTSFPPLLGHSSILNLLRTQHFWGLLPLSHTRVERLFGIDCLYIYIYMGSEVSLGMCINVGPKWTKNFLVSLQNSHKRTVQKIS